MDLVKIWRKYGDPTGPRGGMTKQGRAQWIGPGRVVFHETINGQYPQDQRRHVVWVVIGGTMHRCSVHSVRKVRARERLDFELRSPEDPARWKSLADMIPKRSFVDVLPEEPPAEEEELSEDHPMEPDAKIMLPKPLVRHWSKHPVRSPLPSIAEAPPQPVNSYDPSFSSAVDDDDDDGDGDGDDDDGDGDDDEALGCFGQFWTWQRHSNFGRKIFELKGKTS